MLFNNTFILASTSQSRYSILKKCGLTFSTVKPTCNEVELKTEMLKKKTSPKKIALELARKKSQSVSSVKKNNLILGADTTISFGGGLLNKATNLKEAKKIIKLISGAHHNIYSSASVFYDQKEIWNASLKTTVTIRDLTEKEIDIYLRCVGKSILTCVGCYKVEQLGPNIIKNIKGDFFNVMGLPLFPFLEFLKEKKSGVK